MVIATKIDKQGRILIPKEIREKLGLNNTELRLHVIGNKVIIEPIDTDLENSVNQWAENLRKLNIEAFKIPEEEDDTGSKWFSEEYARQKLGL